MALTESHWPADRSEELLEVTVNDLLRDAAATVGDRIALVDGAGPAAGRRRWTYAELLADSERLARALLDEFSPCERVAVCAPNCAEWVLLQHAAALAGLVLVPLNPAYRSHEIVAVLGGCRAAGIVYTPVFRDNDIAATVARVRDDLADLRMTRSIEELSELTAADPARPLPTVSPGDILQIQFTSGTTGVPKGALLHHRGVVNTSRYVALRAGFPEGGVWVNAMPMFHIGGAAVCRLGCLSRQGTFVSAPGFEPGQMLELIESEGANITLIVPTMILAMLGHADFPRRDLSSLLTVLSGAADVPAALVERTRREMGCDFTILFGQTEINGVLSQTRLTDTVADQSGTLGTPLPHSEVKIADPDDGHVLALGEDGEICVRGYQTMAGYDGLPEDRTIDAEGWLHMGDLGTMDERGYLRIAGRLKDMIIRGGMNLYPREIEDVLFGHPAIAQVSVVGVPDERWGEIVGAVIVSSDPAAATDVAQLSAWCRERLSPHKVPVRWYLVDTFPLTPSGKVQKFRLAEMIASGDLVGSSTGAPPIV